MRCEKSSFGIDGDRAPVVLVNPDASYTSTDPAQEVLHGTCSVLPVLTGNSRHGDEAFCRICHEGISSGDLLSPCECAGSLARVHRICLELWLTASGTSHCELCHYQYPLEKQPKPLTEWFTAPATQHQRRVLCGDVICFLFITPLASFSGWLCVRGAMDLYYSSGMEAIGLILLTVTLFTVYLFWTAVSFRYHVHLFRTWIVANPSLRLQIPCPVKTPQRPAHVAMHFLCKNKKMDTVV